MKKLLLQILFVLSVTILLLTIITFLIDSSLKKQKEDVIGKINEIFNGKENYDALFLGSSRVLMQINPHIIDSVLNINSFNCGMDGSLIIESKMLLSSYLKIHKPPKLVILNIDQFTLYINDTIKLFDFPVYFPYLNEPVVKKTLCHYSGACELVSAMPFLKLSFFDDFKKWMAVKAIINPNGNPENILYKGYSPKKSDWKGENLSSNFTIKYSKEGFELLEDVLKISASEKIKTVVIYAPQTDELSSRLNNFNEYKKLIKECCNSFHVEFYDYSTIPLTKNRNYFYNHLHLNSDGADTFTNLMANDLKKIYKKD